MRFGRPSLCQLPIEGGREQSGGKAGSPSMASSSESLGVGRVGEKQRRRLSAGLPLDAHRPSRLTTLSSVEIWLLARVVLDDRSKEPGWSHQVIVGQTPAR
jgi:hypothetical protein